MKIVFYLILIIGVYSCTERKNKTEIIIDDNLSEHHKDSILNEFKFNYENPSNKSHCSYGIASVQ